LVFQDLCVVPMMLAIPLLSGYDTSAMTILMTLGRAVLIVIGVVLASRLIIPRFLGIIAATRQRHLFVMAVILICIGTAWITSMAGVSLALGAFLAGLVVAGSEYRSQALSDVISFKDVFTSVFFVSIGMLLSAANVMNNIIPILVILLAVLLGKFIVVLVTTLLMQLPLRVSILAAVGLAQIGEFSFLLIRTSQGTNLLDDQLASSLIAVAIITMFLTPFALSLAPQMAAGVGKMKSLNNLLKVSFAEEAAQESSLKDHIIIGGFGFAGQELALALKKCGIGYVIVDLNSENIHRALAQKEPAYYGDITSIEVLERLGVAHALSFVIVINDPSAVEQAIRAARAAAPRIHIIARTRYLLDIEPLKRAGADEIIAAEQEAAVEIVSHILKKCQIEQASIQKETSRIRADINENPSTTLQ
ncbi:MAG: cation:proton antiporter, partial [Candidatus Zixiibacteriota bacterium]